MTFQEEVDLIRKCNAHDFEDTSETYSYMKVNGVVWHVKHRVNWSDDSPLSTWDYLRHHHTSIYAVY